jgi:hypothetical protein
VFLSTLRTFVLDTLFPKQQFRITSTSARYLFCYKCAEGFWGPRHRPVISIPPDCVKMSRQHYLLIVEELLCRQSSPVFFKTRPWQSSYLFTTHLYDYLLIRKCALYVFIGAMPSLQGFFCESVNPDIRAPLGARAYP